MKSDRKSRYIAALITLLFHAAVVVILLKIYLTYPPTAEEPRTWPPVDSAEMLFGGEYVMVGDDPALAAADDEPAPAADEPATAPETAPPAAPPLVTSEKESPAKAEPSKAEREAAEKKRLEDEKRKAIQDRMKNTNFGSADGTGAGHAGQSDGNSTDGATSGTPGFNLKGRSLAYYEQPPRGPLGSITIRVSVNRKGAVTSAEYQSGTGSAAANPATRRHCINAALRSKFSVDEDAAASQIGTITYNFR